MKRFTILGTGWLGFELAKNLKTFYNLKVSSRTSEKIKIYEEEGLSSYILNEDDLESLDELLDTDYLFINFPPSKFDNYLGFLEKIYSHKKISNIKKIIFVSSTSIYPNIAGVFTEESIFNNSSSKLVFEAEKQILEQSHLILRVAGLVGGNRYFGKRSANKIVEFPKSIINFVHRNDVIEAVKFLIDKEINGIYNLCSSIHPTKEEIYSFNAKKYNFDMPIFLNNNEFLNRVIDGSKIEKIGFIYKYNNVFDFE